MKKILNTYSIYRHLFTDRSDTPSYCFSVTAKTLEDAQVKASKWAMYHSLGTRAVTAKDDTATRYLNAQFVELHDEWIY